MLNFMAIFLLFSGQWLTFFSGDYSKQSPKPLDHRRHAMQVTAIFEKVPEGYIAFVEEIPWRR